MNWSKTGYNENEIKLQTISILAARLYQGASTKETMYGRFGIDERPIEPLLYDGEELNWIRIWSRFMTDLAVRGLVGRIANELEDGIKLVREYGYIAHHIRPNYEGGWISTGIWGTRYHDIQMMIAAIHYEPFAVPGDVFPLKSSDNEMWRVRLLQVSTDWCQRSYEINIMKKITAYNETFWGSEGYDSYYWNVLQGKDRDSAPYPFHTLAEERQSNGQSIRIQM